MNPAPWEQKRVHGEASGGGVYQLIVHGWAGAQVEVSTTPELGFGVFGHLQWLTGQEDQFAETYIHLPPRLKRLPIVASDRLDSVVLTDESGTQRARLSAHVRQTDVSLPAGGDPVWKLCVRGAHYRLDFKGHPIILCPTPDIARTIRASVDVMPDGSVCFHRHQVAAWRLLQQWKKRPLSHFRVDVQPLKEYATELLREPARNQLLFGHYGVMSALPAILSEQCLNTNSPWFGAIRWWKDS